MKTNIVYNKSCLDMEEIDDNSIDTIITSPPYWGLRDYGKGANQIWGGDEDCKHRWGMEIKVFDRTGLRLSGDHPRDCQCSYCKGEFKSELKSGQFCLKCGAWYGQLGLEPTLELYLEHLLLITAECKRVLKPTGVLWWNHGDCYGGSGCGKGDYRDNNKRSASNPKLYIDKPNPQLQLTPKCLALQNYRLILKMIDEQGWILRNTVIWSKPNAMPSSVKDRLANKYEPVFMLVKNKKYWFDLDAIRNSPTGRTDPITSFGKHRKHQGTDASFKLDAQKGANPGDVWTIPTQPFSGAKLIADYVGSDGKPYTRSEDCPIHGRNHGSQIRRTSGYDEQPSHQKNRKSGISNHHGQELQPESVSNPCHDDLNQKDFSNGRGQIAGNISENKIADSSQKAEPENHRHIDGRSEKSSYSLDCSSLVDSKTAISHNKRKNKSISQTFLDDSASDKKSCHKFDKEQPVLKADLDLPYSNYTKTKCTCQEVKVDHFATFPEKLIIKPILSSCPEWICKKCGKARVRITKPTKEYAQYLGRGYINKEQEIETAKKEGKPGSASRIETYMDNKPVSTTADYQTIGWTDCGCGKGFRPGIVLDPFAGSGTTLATAHKYHRQYVGYELNPKYLKFINKRLEAEKTLWDMKSE